jgi:hypothetical protein
MKKIDIEKILKTSTVSKKEMADTLFPEALHATVALGKVIKGKQLLNTQQVVKLSDITGIPIAELFTESE